MELAAAASERLDAALIARNESGRRREYEREIERRNQTIEKEARKARLNVLKQQQTKKVNVAHIKSLEDRAARLIALTAPVLLKSDNESAYREIRRLSIFMEHGLMDEDISEYLNYLKASEQERQRNSVYGYNGYNGYNGSGGGSSRIA